MLAAAAVAFIQHWNSVYLTRRTYKCKSHQHVECVRLYDAPCANLKSIDVIWNVARKFVVYTVHSVQERKTVCHESIQAKYKLNEEEEKKNIPSVKIAALPYNLHYIYTQHWWIER